MRCRCSDGVCEFCIFVEKQMKSSFVKLRFFLIFFSVATSLAILFQVALVPHLNKEVAAAGMLGSDNIYFQSVAVRLSERIRVEGWQVWSAYPAIGATGNVAVLAALYAIFGVDTLLIVPINAGLHAFSGFLILLIAQSIWRGRIGNYAGIIIASMFVLSPTSLIWYGQIHKDGYFVAGLLLVIYSWTRAACVGVRVIYVLLPCATGLLLCGFVRPYSLTILLLGLFFIFLMVVLRVILYGSKGRTQLLFRHFLVVVLAFFFVLMAPKSGVESQPYANWKSSDINQHLIQQAPFEWHATPGVPAWLDRGAEVIAKTRAGLIYNSQIVLAKSNIDENEQPRSIKELLLYTPRALQISLFAPFPSTWFSSLGSPGRMVAVFEMAFWYLLAIGVLLEVFRRRNAVVVEVVVFCFLTLIVYGLTMSNLGTLHRVRFPYISILMLIGLSGWVYYLQKNWRVIDKLNKLRALPNSEVFVESNDVGGARSAIAKSGLAILIFTTITFLGFFIRDVMMARMYGLGYELDAFVIASVAPMFMVSVFSVPLGTAIVPFVLQQKIARDNDAGAFVYRIFTFYFLCVAIFAICFLFGGLYALHSTTWGLSLPQGQVAKVVVLSLWMLAIFILSGFLTIANGILNALGNPFLPALAQLSVPTIVIAALVVFGTNFGVMVVPIAMFIGQLFNLVLLIRGLVHEGFVFVPWPYKLQIDVPKEFLGQYFPLVIASVFMQVSVPVSTMMATSLQSGDIGALGLGGKLVVFLMGLITAGLASVVLPYFSNMLVQNRVIEARRELSFLLLSATVATIPLTVLLYLSSNSIVKIFFEGGVFDKDSTLLVANVMEFGALQLPFFVVNMIMLKYAIAMKRTRFVLLASFIGVLVNVFLNTWLSNFAGVAGVSLSMSMSVAVTAGLMLVVFFREREVAWLDLIFIWANWLLFVSMVVCLHYRSWVGVFAAFLAYGLLLYSEWQTVSRGRHVRVSA